MNFDYNDEQREIKSAAAQLLAARLKPGVVREHAEAGTYADAVWGELRELGWTGIAVEESYGGQGLGLVDLVILLEELGAALAPVPFLSSVSAALVLQQAGSDEQKARWLPGLASGETTGTVALLRGGRSVAVPDAASADVLILVQDGRARAVPRADAGVEPVEGLDLTRRFAAVEGGEGEDLPGDVRAGLDRVAVAIGGELLGVAQRAMEMAVAYAKERKQFGHPVGTYQAVQHRCAQMLFDVESARSAVYYAAWAADHEPESLPLAAACAKASASDAGWGAAANALQVFGGIGFTWEHDLQLYLKRAKADAHLFGSAREHRDGVADLLGV
jgi:alkylation response protein AidB-like acyl-CoA dehydrogenase